MLRLAAWAKRFPDEFYEHIFRLKSNLAGSNDLLISPASGFDQRPRVVLRVQMATGSSGSPNGTQVDEVIQ